jgi:hypothetical protein
VARAVVKQITASQTIRHSLGLLRTRFELLKTRQSYSAEWRLLQYDAVQALIDAQRELVGLHSQILSVLKADRALYRSLQLESLEAQLACDAVRELIREIERAVPTLVN